MTELGGGVDELEVDLLQSTTAGLHQQRLKSNEEIMSLSFEDTPASGAKFIYKLEILNFVLTLRRVSTLFLVPMTQPFTMTKSLCTSP